MLQTLGTVILLGLMTAFAVSAVLLNRRGEAAGPRGRRGRGAAAHREQLATEYLESFEAFAVTTGDRRLPVGDFLFGALYLRAGEPLAFSARWRTPPRKAR